MRDPIMPKLPDPDLVEVRKWAVEQYMNYVANTNQYLGSPWMPTEEQIALWAQKIEEYILTGDIASDNTSV